MINISMEGVRDAVEVFRDIIVPWRRQNAQRKINLENAQRQAEIQKLNAETKIAQAKAERERVAIDLDKTQAELTLAQARKTEAEASMLIAQAKKALLEVEKEQVALRQSSIQLAMLIVEKYSPEIIGTQKIDYVMKLLPILDQLSSTKFEPEILIPPPSDLKF